MPEPAAGAAPPPPAREAVSNLPALIADLPGDETRAPQTQFTLDLRIAFLETLAVSGSVRSAARRVKISHQSVYRARRSSTAFGRAWDAAMVVARGQAEALLADYALGGVEEEVWYHGEIVGKRRRVSDRLLLAHLGRLDRLRSDARIDALAEDFEGMIARMRAGEPIDADAAGGTPENLSPGQCNTRSMSRAQTPPPPPDAPVRDEPPCDCIGAQTGTDGGAAHYRAGPQGLEPVPNLYGEGPCCDRPRWPRCGDCPHFPAHEALACRMDEARPAEAPPHGALGNMDAVAECQMAAFEAGDEDWWRYGENFDLFECVRGVWVKVEDGAEPVAEDADDGVGEGAEEGAEEGDLPGEGAEAA